jgi:RNA polymerase sigma-70 factor (ECF subfamily)
MNSEESFAEYRSLLFAIAYRMLGTVMDAEDAVQETFLRWQSASMETIENPRAFLSAITTRLCIDQLRSARQKRETYIGPWLPEPYLTDPQTPMLDTTILAESLSTAFLVLLEQLTPTERAVFLLREVFDYDYAEIAEIVGKTPANCRKMISRARTHLKKERPRFDTEPEQQRRLVSNFMETVLSGDMDGLLNVLAEDIVVYSDGGGNVVAAQKPVAGREMVARFLFGIARLAPPELEIRLAQVNGLPGAIYLIAGQVSGVFAMDIQDDRIQNIFTVLNPDKLRHLNT